MSPPEIRSLELGGAEWFYVTALYATPMLGLTAFEELMRLPRGDVGVYRHGEPGVSEGQFVSAVSLKHSEARRMRKHLAHGDDVELPRELVESMVRRRARVVVEAMAASPGKGGRLRISHAGHGARLDSDGEMREPPPGRG